MNSKSIKNFIIKFDLLGPAPSLRTFCENNFKSFKSAIISIIGILMVIAFLIYSIIDYSKFDNPTIVYWKDNTKSRNLTINLSDKLFMVQVDHAHDFNFQVPFVQLMAFLVFESSDLSYIPINLERCELGKNIDLKHKESIEKFELPRDQFYTDYLCIKKEDSNITLFNDPKAMEQNYFVILVQALENFTLSPNDVYLKYVVESDSIDHFDKNNPSKKNFVLGETMSFDETTLINSVINLNYIEYETDNSVFFSSNKIYEGVEFFNQNDLININYYNFYEMLKTNKKALMGLLTLRINEKSFERYKRTYPKLQSLIADVISTIQLILLIYEFLTDNIYSKKIDIEIIKSILSKKFKEEIKKKSNNKKEEDNISEQTIQIKNSTNTYKGNIFFDEINLKNNKNILTNNKFMEETKSESSIINNKNTSFKLIKNIKNKININNNKNILLEEMNQINFWNLFFYHFSCCFKQKRKIIEKCGELLDKELSIENIVDKMLKLEDINSNKGGKIMENKNLKEIIELLKIK